MAQNYLDFEGLSTFLSGLFRKFALLKHDHTTSEITDYVVDSELSSSSTNPVQNKVVNTGFSIVGNSISSLQTAINNKADSTHEHENYATTSYVEANFALKTDVQDIDLSDYYTKEEVDDLELVTTNDIDAICGTRIQIANEVMF